jgi:Heavy-metal resistance
MTDGQSTGPIQPPASSGWSRYVPVLRSRWWTGLLALSLMANLLVGGIALGHRFGPERGERLMGASAAQLVPRKFFMELPPERRRELLGDVRTNMRDLRGLRDGSSPAVLQIADTLAAEPFDQTRFRQAVDAYATGPDSLSVRGATIINGLIAKLTPEERQQLARAMRDRAAGRKRRD